MWLTSYLFYFNNTNSFKLIGLHKLHQITQSGGDLYILVSLFHVLLQANVNIETHKKYNQNRLD